jgi:O-antigen ligase
MDWVFVAFGASIAVSIAWSYLALGAEFNVRDLFELPKVLLYYGVFRLVASVDWRSEDVAREAVLVAGVTTSIVLLAFMQYMDLFGINAYVTPLFAPPWHVLKILTIGRVTATVTNPNYLSFVLIWPLTLCFLVLLRAVRRRPLVVRTFAFLACGIVLVAGTMGMAASRTAFVSAGLGIGVVAAVLVWKSRPERRRPMVRAVSVALVLLIVLSIVGVLLASTLPTPSASRGLLERLQVGFGDVFSIEELQEAGEMGSWERHLERWDFALDEIASSPVFGRGPSKSMVEALELPPTDNEYLYQTVRYGVVGLLPYLALFGGMAVAAATRLRPALVDSRQPTDFLAPIVLAIVVAAAAFNVLAGSFYNIQVWPLVMYSFGLLWGTTTPEGRASLAPPASDGSQRRDE